MRFVGLVIFAMCASDTLAQTAPAQPTSRPEPPELVFELISRRAGASIQLINGSEPVRLSDWDTVVVTPVPDKANPDRFCTGTLVGPGVILLAAHCIDRRSTPGDRSAGLKIDNQTLPLTCDAPDEYYAGEPWSEPSPRRSQDFAVCVAPGAAAQATIAKMRFDQVDVRPLPVDAAVLMTGYGCTDIRDAKVRMRTLRIGDSEIRVAADGLGPRGAYAELVSTGTEPALCNGDSGGALMTGATVAQPYALRRIRGVNSTTEDLGGAVISRVAMLSDPSFSVWAEAFVAKYPGAYVCGLSKSSPTMRCRP
ncbi:trypsin-like serine protease [Sphingobium ummariense]